MTIGRRIDQRRFIGRGPLDWKTLMLVAAHHLRAVSSCQNPETGHKTLSGVRIDLKPRNPKFDVGSNSDRGRKMQWLSNGLAQKTCPGLSSSRSFNFTLAAQFAKSAPSGSPSADVSSANSQTKPYLCKSPRAPSPETQIV